MESEFSKEYLIFNSRKYFEKNSKVRKDLNEKEFNLELKIKLWNHFISTNSLDNLFNYLNIYFDTLEFIYDSFHLKTNCNRVKDYYSQFSFNTFTFIEIHSKYFFNNTNYIEELLDQSNLVILDEDKIVARFYRKNQSKFKIIDYQNIINKYFEIKHVNILSIIDKFKNRLVKINQVKSNKNIFIINSLKSIERFNYVNQILNYFQESSNIFILDAILPKDDLETNLFCESLLYRNYFELKYFKMNKYSSFTKGAIGLILSNLVILKYVLEQKINNYYLFEDDILFHKNFLELFNKNNSLEADIFMLGKKTTELLTLDYHQLNPNDPVWGTHALNITNLETSQKLFKIYTSFEAPIDKLFNQSDLKIFYPKEDLIISQITLPSLISKFTESYEMWNWKIENYQFPKKFNFSYYLENFNKDSTWNIIKNLIYQNADSSHNTVFFDFVDKEFGWESNKNYRLNNNGISCNWMGIIHHPYQLESYWGENISVASYLKSDFMKLSLKKCSKLITLSQDLKNNLEKNGLIKKYKIPIEVIYHPFDFNSNHQSFSINKFNKKILFVGWSFRNFSTFHKLQIPYEKIFVRQVNLEQKNRIKEIEEKQLQKNKIKKEFIKILENLSNNEYFDLISHNILFLDFDGVSANNIIVEAIKRNIPMIIKKHPAIIEYLGKDYPFYFNDVSEINSLSKEVLYDKIVLTNQYLIDMDKTKFHILNFVNFLSKT